MNVVEPIFAQCRNKASELALCAPGTEFNLVSYARLQRSVDNICRRIIATGMAPRSCVGIAIEDPIFHAMVVIALTRLGMVTASASDRNVQWPIAVDAVITDRSVQSTPNNILADSAWTEGDERPLAEKYLYRATVNELCRIVLTPADDGSPTAIGFTYGMIAARLDRQKLFFGSRAPFCDRTHLDLPLATPLGFQVMLGVLWRGGALMMTWDVRKTLAALAGYKIQNLIAAPQNLLKFADAAESSLGYRSNLIAVFSAGSMEPEFLERVRARLCSNLTVGYVAPDATMVASMPAQVASVNPGAVGYILPGVLVEIVDEQDRTLPMGHDGRVRVRSEYGVNEFFKDTKATRRAFRNGWFYPGERAHLTANNMLVLSNVDQSSAGSSVERVEKILSNHVNVMQCGVVSVTNEFNVEELCALVVPRSYFDPEALRSYSRAHLPAALVPARFVAVSDLPQSAAGEIDRAKLPELLKSQLNSVVSEQ